METILLMLLGALIGGGAVYLVMMQRSLTDKAHRFAKIHHLLQRADRVTNDDIQRLLEVSDATAERYLDELERDGVLKQIGKTGKYVHYEKVVKNSTPQ